MNKNYSLLQIVLEKIKSVPGWIEDNYEWISIVVTLLAVLVAIWTLFEMKIQRNKAYQPDVVFSNLRLFVDTGITEVDGEKIEDVKYAFIPAGEKWDIGNGTEKVTIKISDFGREEFYVAIPAYNTGVGVCKNLNCVYSQKSYDAWFNLLIEENIIKKDESIEDSWTTCSINEFFGTYAISKDKTIVKESFLTPNCTEVYYLKIPFEYYLFLMAIQNVDDFYKIKNVNLPPIEFKMSYKDVQGKKYQRTANIKISPFSTTVSKDNTIVFVYDIMEE